MNQSMTKIFRWAAMYGAFLTSFSCSFNETEMVGLYAPVGYINTFDTIKIASENKYYRSIYTKSGHLVLEMEGDWQIEGTYINFDSPYFFNLDRDLEKFPELLQDTVSNGGGRVTRKNGAIVFCVGYLENENCYEKINN